MKYLKKFEALNVDIDPFGEENWEENESKFVLGELVRAKTSKHYGYRESIYQGVYYYITDIIQTEDYTLVSVREASGGTVFNWFDQDNFYKAD